MEAVFWISLGLIAYTYFGYPLVLICLRPLLKKPVLKKDITPSVTMIIAAYNEEKDIRDKMENCLDLDYPKEKLEILVASDSSTDRTNEIVQEYGPKGITLIALPDRGGKTAAQNAAVELAKGEILVFSDAPTIYKRDALRKLVRNFADPSIGCVTGELVYTNDKHTFIGEGGALYWQYETWIKRMESDIGSVLGATGCIYALRKELYLPFEYVHLVSDFLSPLRLTLQSLDDDFLTPLKLQTSDFQSRSVMEEEAIAIERVSESTQEEFRMRCRVITRAIIGLIYMRAVLNPLKFPMSAFEIFSHKVLRWSVPLFLCLMLLSNLFLLDSWFYQLTLMGQGLFYFCAVVGYFADKWKLNKFKVFYVPYYFSVVNLSAFWAIVKVLLGKNDGLWTPIRN